MKVGGLGNHGKMYSKINKPKQLEIVCQFCEHRYIYKFKSTETDKWNNELKTDIVCPECKKKRI